MGGIPLRRSGSIDAGRKRQSAFLEKPRLPGGIERLVESYIEKKTGKPWNDPAVLDRIANAILAQKSRYWKERQVSYRKAYHVLGYLVYHAPGLSLSLPRASGARTATCSNGVAYGDIVRFNRDHDAYNLVILPTTRIEPVREVSPGGVGRRKKISNQRFCDINSPYLPVITTAHSLPCLLHLWLNGIRGNASTSRPLIKSSSRPLHRGAGSA